MNDKYHIWETTPVWKAVQTAKAFGSSPDILAVTPHDVKQMLDWSVENEEYELAAKLRDKLEVMNMIIKQIEQNEELQDQ
jgi:protein-arginine kinase activator protein McsA